MFQTASTVEPSTLLTPPSALPNFLPNELPDFSALSNAPSTSPMLVDRSSAPPAAEPRPAVTLFIPSVALVAALPALSNPARISVILSEISSIPSHFIALQNFIASSVWSAISDVCDVRSFPLAAIAALISCCILRLSNSGDAKD